MRAEVAARPSETAGTAPSAAAVATLRAIYIVWWRDLLRFWRDRWRLGASLAQPLLYLIVFGTGLGSALRGAGGGAFGTSYQQFLYPGVIGMSVVFTAIFGAMSIVWDREFGFLKELLVAPIDRSALAIGKTLGGSTQALLQGAILLVLAPFVGVKLGVLEVIELLIVIFLLAFSLSALGVAIASRMRSMQGFQVVMNFLMMPIFFLSGALFPLVGLPAWMTVLTRLDPAAYGMDPLRRIALSGSGMPAAVLDRIGITVFGQTLGMLSELAVLVAFGLAMLAVAVLNFRRRD